MRGEPYVRRVRHSEDGLTVIVENGERDAHRVKQFFVNGNPQIGAVEPLEPSLRRDLLRDHRGARHRSGTDRRVKPTAFRRLLQIGTFLRKESLDVLHQPRLLLTLVIGPFAILAVFGIGYKDTSTPMRSLFVGAAGSPLLEQVKTYANDISTSVKFIGVSNDLADAERQLAEGDIDLIVSFPEDPLNTVLTGKQAPITVIHTRLDPIERTAIRLASQLAVDEINSRILAAVVEGGRGFADPAADVLAKADTALTSLDTAINTGDTVKVSRAIGDLQAATSELSTSDRLITAVSQQMTAANPNDEGLATAQREFEQLRATVQSLDANTSAADVAEARTALTTINDNYAKVSGVDPAVLVRPFDRKVQLNVSGGTEVTDWYAPAAIVLVLQQFGVAFGALSFVRERQFGIVEVFRVAPVNAAETVIGKYLAYLLIGGAIGGILTALAVLALGVPLASGVAEVAIAMGLSLFASIGIGFVISLASSSDAQAVQYTMILLLASLFFSGFFLSLAQMQGGAQWAGYLLPVTYGMQLLRDVMLRGDPLELTVTLQLLGFGLVMFTLALFGTRRRMAVAR